MEYQRQRKNRINSPLACALFSLLLATTSCVLSVLCIKGATGEFWKKNGFWVTALVSLFFAIYYAVSVFSILKEKQTLFRLMISGYILFLFSFAIWFILQKTGFFQVVGDRDKLQAYLQKSGGWMPFLYILLQFLQVVLLPIPGFVSTAVGVTIFGPFISMLCSFIGVLFGSIFAFWIGRKLGYKAVAWMVGEDALKKWLKKVKGKDNFILTIMFVLPLFPDDILCFVAGLSTMTWQYFLSVVLAARAVGIACTCYSVNFIPFNTWWGILIWVGIIVSVALFCVLLYKRLDCWNDWLKEKSRKKKEKNP